MNANANEWIDRALHDPVRQFAHRPGKQIRSSIAQLSYEIAGGKGRIPGVIGQAIECLHGGSLIIDDIQDDSDSRRGQPTLHQVLGVPLAINAGNWMYFRALELLSDSSLPPSQRTNLIAAMVKAGRRCHEGQALDLTARVDQLPMSHWAEIAESISTRKTGVLVALAVQLGCVAANASSSLTSRLQNFGNQIGIALQMRNDLDELTKTAESLSENRPGPIRQAPGPDETDSPTKDLPPFRKDSEIAFDATEYRQVRDDDLRNRRVTWPWVWARQLAGENECRSLIDLLGQTLKDRQSVAAKLLTITQAHGDDIIASTIQEQIRLLGEHTVEQRLLTMMRDRLRPIECSAKKPRGQSPDPTSATLKVEQ